MTALTMGDVRPDSIISIEFAGPVMLYEKRPYVAVRPICDALKLMWGSQYNRIKRKFTCDVTEKVLRELWPEHALYVRRERPKNTQTKLFDDHSPKPGETDLLLLPGSLNKVIGFKLAV